MNMKIALINSSPKAKESASEAVLQMLKPLLHDENEIIEYNFRESMLNDNDLEQIAECNALVFAFPLYVDGIPSHLLNCLYKMEAFFKTKPAGNLTVYSLVNCGFYEGQQASIALEIMKNWCEKAKLNWGQGIGIGGGGMLKILTGVPNGQGPKKNLWIALESIASNITAAAAADNIYISPNLPRFVYKLGAEAGWRQQIKANGLKRKDLFARK
jgi:hypothetical protein